MDFQYQEAIENYIWLEVEFEKLKDENEALKLQVSAAKTVIASQDKHLALLSKQVNQLPMLDSERDANERLTNENEALKACLNKGLRVTAINHPSGLVGFMEDAPTFDDQDRTNATLILDEVE